MRNYFKETDQVVRRELRRIVRQPMYWVLMVVLPVVSFAFFAVIFERGVARNIPIAVLDEDHTTLSRKVTQMIDDTPTAMVSYEVQSMEEAQRLIADKAYLTDLLRQGAEKAGYVANKTLRKVYKKIGFLQL